MIQFHLFLFEDREENNFREMLRSVGSRKFNEIKPGGRW